MLFNQTKEEQALDILADISNREQNHQKWFDENYVVQKRRKKKKIRLHTQPDNKPEKLPFIFHKHNLNQNSFAQLYQNKVKSYILL